MTKTARPIVVTVGSHSALQILKGARDEGLANAVVAAAGRDRLYRRYDFVDEVVVVPAFDAVPLGTAPLGPRGGILVPHGSLVAYVDPDGRSRLGLPTYGSPAVLDWEADRGRQRRWLAAAGLNLPGEWDDPAAVDEWPVLVKAHGAPGGRGCELAANRAELAALLTRRSPGTYTLQAYVVGVTMYVHYFQSVLDGRLEILGMDRRYETTVDGLGRLPSGLQAQLQPEPTYVVVGNQPVVLRESLLETAYAMGEGVVAASKEMVDPRGLWGPFCLETVLTPDLKFHVIEISCRIVAGTNLFVEGSPYSALFFDEPMSTGRRIARELRRAAEAGRLGEITAGAP